MRYVHATVREDKVCASVYLYDGARARHLYNIAVKVESYKAAFERKRLRYRLIGANGHHRAVFARSRKLAERAERLGNGFIIISLPFKNGPRSYFAEDPQGEFSTDKRFRFAVENIRKYRVFACLGGQSRGVLAAFLLVHITERHSVCSRYREVCAFLYGRAVVNYVAFRACRKLLV